MCSNDEQKQIKLCVSTANEFYSLASTINPASSLYTYIVNEGFACELFLKAIAMKEHTDGKYKHLHSLKELWLDISANAQNEIQEHFFKTSHVNLTEFLDEANNAFKQWRYAFEAESIKLTISSLEAFAQSLRDYCNKAKCSSCSEKENEK